MSRQTPGDEVDEERCTCPAEPHACSYQEEIEGNDDPEYCTCCEFCEKDRCLDAI